MYSSAYNISIKKIYMRKIKQNSKENELKKYTPHNLFSSISFLPRSSFFIYNFLLFLSFAVPDSARLSPNPRSRHLPLLDVLNILYIILYINYYFISSTYNID